MKSNHLLQILSTINNADNILIIVPDPSERGGYRLCRDYVRALDEILRNINDVSYVKTAMSTTTVKFKYGNREKSVMILTDSYINDDIDRIRGRIFDKIIVDEYCKIYKYVYDYVQYRIRKI